MNTTPTWLYEKNGHRKEALSETHVRDLIASGVIDGKTLVWSQGFPNWTPLAETALAMHLPVIQEPPPLPSALIGNGVVWVLAFAPLIGLLLRAMIAGAMSSSEYTVEYETAQAINSGQYWYVTALLNVGLSCWDLNRLKHAGVATASFGRLVFIVPVYLWKRAKTLHLSPACFWVWIVTFLISIFVKM
ncbi:MAG: DUF4339 domain-containing protein [Formivibrio sp.]|nr:DUF4339 domain-containing protein [Formivibrio sp.]